MRACRGGSGRDSERGSTPGCTQRPACGLAGSMSHVFVPGGALAQKAKFLIAVARGDAHEAEKYMNQLKLTGVLR